MLSDEISRLYMYRIYFKILLAMYNIFTKPSRQYFTQVSSCQRLQSLRRESLPIAKHWFQEVNQKQPRGIIRYEDGAADNAVV